MLEGGLISGRGTLPALEIEGQERLEGIEWEGTRIYMHWPGIEPGPPAWQARILPLNHQCLRKLHQPVNLMHKTG